MQVQDAIGLAQQPCPYALIEVLPLVHGWLRPHRGHPAAAWGYAVLFLKGALARLIYQCFSRLFHHLKLEFNKRQRLSFFIMQHTPATNALSLEWLCWPGLAGLALWLSGRVNCVQCNCWLQDRMRLQPSPPATPDVVLVLVDERRSGQHWPLALAPWLCMPMCSATSAPGSPQSIGLDFLLAEELIWTTPRTTCCWPTPWPQRPGGIARGTDRCDEQAPPCRCLSLPKPQPPWGHRACAMDEDGSVRRFYPAKA